MAEGDEEYEELLDACREGDVKQVCILLEKGSDVNYVDPSDGNTALHMASANGFANIVRILQSRGARAIKNHNGNTPLHWAILNKHVDVIKELLDKQIDIDVLDKNEFGKSALDQAFQTKDENIITIVLAHPSAAPVENEVQYNSPEGDEAVIPTQTPPSNTTKEEEGEE